MEHFLVTGVTNGTESYNRVITQLKPIGCSCRNQANYERRINLSHRR